MLNALSAPCVYCSHLLAASFRTVCVLFINSALLIGFIQFRLIIANQSQQTKMCKHDQLCPFKLSFARLYQLHFTVMMCVYINQSSKCLCEQVHGMAVLCWPSSSIRVDSYDRGTAMHRVELICFDTMCVVFATCSTAFVNRSDLRLWLIWF